MSEFSETDTKLLLAGLPVLKVAELPLPHRPVIYYRDGGSADGIPIVMLHGGSSDSGDYRGQLAGLGERFRMISWCTPGYGGSTPLLQDDPTGEDYADVLRAFTTSLGLDSFHLVGSSLGSVIGACFATRYPDAVKSLTQISPNTGSGFLSGEARAVWLKNWLDRHVILDADPQALATLLTTPATSELVKLRVGTMREAVTERGYAQVIRMMSNVDTVRVAPQIRCPVLILNGAADMVAPYAEHGVPIAAAIPRCRVEILPGYGHLLQMEAPSLVNRLITEFILPND